MINSLFVIGEVYETSTLKSNYLRTKEQLDIIVRLGVGKMYNSYLRAQLRASNDKEAICLTSFQEISHKLLKHPVYVQEVAQRCLPEGGSALKPEEKRASVQTQLRVGRARAHWRVVTQIRAWAPRKVKRLSPTLARPASRTLASQRGVCDGKEHEWEESDHDLPAFPGFNHESSIPGSFRVIQLIFVYFLKPATHLTEVLACFTFS